MDHGASSGIGEALARVMARAGWRVYASARRAGRLEALAAELKAERSDADLRPLVLDVTDRAATAAAVARIYEESGRLDQAVLNAGIYWPQRATDFRADDVHEMFRVNVGGIAEGLEAILPRMIDAGAGGRICLMGSTAGYRGLPTAPGLFRDQGSGDCHGRELEAGTRSSRTGAAGRLSGLCEVEASETNAFPMPMLMETEDAAQAFYRGLTGHSRFEITFPKTFAQILKMMMSLPYWLFFAAMRPLAPKPGEDMPSK